MQRPLVPCGKRRRVRSGEQVDSALPESGRNVLGPQAEDSSHNGKLGLHSGSEISTGRLLSPGGLKSQASDIREVIYGLEEVLEVRRRVLQAQDLASLVGLRARVLDNRLGDSIHVFEDLAMRGQNGSMHSVGNLLSDENDTSIRVPDVSVRREVDRRGVRLLL